jgi:hypothetical protein
MDGSMTAKIITSAPDSADRHQARRLPDAHPRVRIITSEPGAPDRREQRRRLSNRRRQG